MGVELLILIDTHIWVWWANDEPDLGQERHRLIRASRHEGIAVSAISCWEVAMLVDKGRLKLSCPVEEWVFSALLLPGVQSVPLTAQMAFASMQLPGDFHKDPADRFLVATARVLGIPILTNDGKIQNYEHVEKAGATAG